MKDKYKDVVVLSTDAHPVATGMASKYLMKAAHVADHVRSEY